MSRLEGQVAIVTGAARGLGLAIATAIAQAGADVAMVDLDEHELEHAARQLDAAVASRVSAHPADVSDLAAIGATIDAVAGAHGRIDALVNNAGGSAHTPLRLEDVEEEHYERVFDWNVKSAIFCTKAALPHLRAAGKSTVVNLASISGRAGNPLFSPQYSAAKGAIIALTHNLAHHLGPDGVRVNAIAPGFIRSGERAESIWRSRDTEALQASIPLRRRGEAQEIATATVFLLSDESSYISGQVLDVNGGWVAN
ncbi:MAG: SDR family NAD(P)-dependent oxidoreductase [Solirubrobacteraceae bacterium]